MFFSVYWIINTFELEEKLSQKIEIKKTCGYFRKQLFWVGEFNILASIVLR